MLFFCRASRYAVRLPRPSRFLFFLTRRREGAKKAKAKQNGGLSCRCAAIHAADKKARRLAGGAERSVPHGMPRGWRGAFFFSREGAKARRRQRQSTMAACLAAARQFTPPIKRREGWQGGQSVQCLTACREGGGGHFFSHAKARRREEDKGKAQWRPVLPLRGNSRRRSVPRRLRRGYLRGRTCAGICAACRARLAGLGRGGRFTRLRFGRWCSSWCIRRRRVGIAVLRRGRKLPGFFRSCL